MTRGIMISSSGAKSLQNDKYKRNHQLLQKYRDTAREIAVNWSKDPDVVAVVAFGGVANNNVDRHSDIDLGVFVKSPKVKRIRVGEYLYRGCPLDILVFRYPQSFARDWDDIQRDAFSSCLILIDKTGRLAETIRRKVKLIRSEVQQRIASRIMYLAWLGIHSKHLARKQHKTYDWNFPADLLAMRGELVGAHGLLQHCTDLAIQLLYAVNERPVPDYKWRFVRVRCLPWVPPDFDARLRDVLTVRALSHSELKRRIRSLEILVEVISDYAEKRGLLPKRIYQYFLRKSPDYEVF